MFLATNGIVASRGINSLWTGLLTYHTGDNTPNDALGVANGTLTNGATYATGKINNGFSLDGVNDYVDLGAVSAYNFGTSDFSISFWINWGASGPNKAIFSIGGYATTDLSLSIYANSDKISVWRRASGGSYSLIGDTTAGTININTWYNVVLRRNGSTIDVFINNTKYTLTTGASYSLGNSTGTCMIGENGYGLYYQGKVDELGVWSRALSDSEVTELYNSGSGKQYPN